MRKIIILLFLISTTFLTSCTSSGPNLDKGILEDDPCKAPCWNGLTIGQSTTQDVENFIQKLNSEEWKYKHTHTVNKTGCNVTLITDKSPENSNSAIRFYIENEHLTYILSTHGDMPRLKEVVAHFGTPEYLEALYVIGPDGKMYMLEVFYPSLGLSFQVDVSEKDKGSIREDMKISNIQLYEPGDLINYYLAKNGCDLGRSGAEKLGKTSIKNYIKAWSGFGEIQVIEVK
jgi:hypothetical protein